MKRGKTIKGKTGMSLTIYPWTHPASGKSCWRFAWRESPSAPWRYTTAASKAKAEASASERLEELEGGGLIWSALTEKRRRFLSEIHHSVSLDEEGMVLDYLQSRADSCNTQEAVDRFIAGKVSAAGELTPYLRQVKRFLEHFSKAFAEKSLSDIHLPLLSEWLNARNVGKGWKIKKDSRAYLVEFWKWCQREGIAGRDPVTVAERLPNIATGSQDRRVLTVAELQSILDNVGSAWRAWVVLGAFAGMRPQEIVPHRNKKINKRGLHCEEIDFDFGVIRLPACVAKGGKRPRIIPLNDALKAGLEWAGIRPGMSGPIVTECPVGSLELLRLGKLIFKDEGWPQDALRHSFGSYRNAIIRSLEQVAEEMGTSVNMLHKHYHNPKAEAEGLDWFNVRPSKVPICSDGIEVNVQELDFPTSQNPHRIKKKA